MSAYTTLFETVARFSIQHIGAEKTYEVFTSLVLLLARLKQLQIAMGSSSLTIYLMIPIIATVVIALTASSVAMRVGGPVLMLAILLLAINAELASYGLSL